MITKKKRQLIMIISISVPIVIIIGILIALYFTTDKLFEKYIAQNINIIDEMAKKKPKEIMRSNK